MTTLREADVDDLQPLVALAQRSWTEVESSIDAVLGRPLDRLVTPSWAAHHDAVVREVCGADDATVLVAEEHGSLVGFVAWRVHPASAGMSSYGEVVVLAVAPEARGDGLGRRLVDAALAALRTAGAPVIVVETGGDEKHSPARALYESAGFRRLPVAQYWIAGADDDAPDT